MTKEYIKKDENFLCGLELPDQKVDVYLVYTGTEKVQYYFFLEGELLFSGNDFRPSPLFDIDSLDSIASLLGFLTLGKGDTDNEYFKDYTPDQFKWSESSECADLSCIISDYEVKDSEYHKPAKKRLKKHFIQ